MRHGKQTAAFFLAAAMVMSSSPAVVFAEELESGAEQETTVTAGQSRIRDYRNPYHKRVAGRNGRTVELGIYRAGTEVYP